MANGDTRRGVVSNRQSPSVAWHSDLVRNRRGGGGSGEDSRIVDRNHDGKWRLILELDDRHTTR
jgi:hypothetical protein